MRRFFLVLISIAIVGSFASMAQALEVPAAPPLDRPVVDTTGTLSDEQIDRLAAHIGTGRKEKSYQLGVLMISSLEGQSIEDYSLQVARGWGIGEKGKNNGVLLLIAKNDRKLRIEVGSGLEGELTDAESGRIIRNTITPRFKESEFFEGIQAGVASIQAQVEGRASPDADKEQAAEGDLVGAIVGYLFFGFFVLSWLASILARTKSWWAGGLVGAVSGGILALISGWTIWALIMLPFLVIGGLLFDFLVSRNFRQHAGHGENASWWAGGTWLGGSGGSSGGGGFGGGGFSGGGSSGSW